MVAYNTGLWNLLKKKIKIIVYRAVDTNLKKKKTSFELKRAKLYMILW